MAFSFDNTNAVQKALESGDKNAGGLVGYFSANGFDSLQQGSGNQQGARGADQGVESLLGNTSGQGFGLDLSSLDSSSMTASSGSSSG